MIALLLTLSMLLPTGNPPVPDAPAPPRTGPAGDTLTVPQRYSPGDQYAWSFVQGGQPIGYHVFRYEGPVVQQQTTTHRFREWTSLNTGLPVLTRMTAELITDDRGRALHQVVEVSRGVNYSRLEIGFLDGSAQASLSEAGSERSLTIAVTTPVWLQVNNMPGGFDLALSLNPVAEERLQAFRMFSSTSLQPFDYKVWWVEEAEPGDIPGAATILQDSLGEMLTVDGQGHLLSFAIDAQRLTISRTEAELPLFELSPPPRAPAENEYASREVRIDHGEVSLAGTLTHRRDLKGPRPAILFLSGSGPQDRNGFSNGIDMGTHEVLDFLVRRGLTVLRVDDRGVGQSTGPTDNMGLVDLVTDARTCVDFLSAQPGVDPDRIALIGHSEGGVVAPIVALQRPRIAALVLMAASARPLPEVMLDQNALSLTRAGIVGEQQTAALATIRARFEQLASNAELSPDDVGAEFLPLLNNRTWFRQHAHHDPLDTLARVQCPVLIVQGAKDFQVSPEKDAQALLTTLDKAGNSDHSLELFAGLDHLFKRVAGETSTLAEYYTRRPLDPGFLTTLGDWLDARLLPPE